MGLGSRLRTARAHAHLTQKQLEDRSHVSQKTISKIERGDQPSSGSITKLAKACGVRPEWLADDDGPMLADHVAQERPAKRYHALSEAQVQIADLWGELTTEQQRQVRSLLLTLATFNRLPTLRPAPGDQTVEEYIRRLEQEFVRMRDLMV